MRISPVSESTTFNFTFSHKEHCKFTCSGVNPAVGNFTESKMELAPPGSGAGAPGNAGKSSLDIWNSEEWSAGCFTIPTGEKLGYLTFPFFLKKYHSCFFRIPQEPLQHHHRGRGSLKGQKELRLDRRCGEETVEPKVALVGFWFCQLTPSSLRTVDSAN